MYHIFIPFYDWIKYLCRCTLLFVYPFICWWTLGLFPPFGFCEQCFSEHWHTNICLTSCFQFLLTYTISFQHLAMMCLGVDLLSVMLRVYWASWIHNVSHSVWEVFNHYTVNIFLLLSLLSFSYFHYTNAGMPNGVPQFCKALLNFLHSFSLFLRLCNLYQSIFKFSDCSIFQFKLTVVPL